MRRFKIKSFDGWCSSIFQAAFFPSYHSALFSEGKQGREDTWDVNSAEFPNKKHCSTRSYAIWWAVRRGCISQLGQKPNSVPLWERKRRSSGVFKIKFLDLNFISLLFGFCGGFSLFPATLYAVGLIIRVAPHLQRWFFTLTGNYIHVQCYFEMNLNQIQNI